MLLSVVSILIGGVTIIAEESGILTSLLFTRVVDSGFSVFLFRGGLALLTGHRSLFIAVFVGTLINDSYKYILTAHSHSLKADKRPVFLCESIEKALSDIDSNVTFNDIGVSVAVSLSESLGVNDTGL